MRSDDATSDRFALGTMRTTASHTIGIPHLAELLRAVPADADADAYRDAVVDANVLGRPTHAGRLRTYRHLRELYLLDPARPAFAALRRLWAIEPDAQPLIAGVQAFTRDELLRASYVAIERASPGDVVTSADLAAAVMVEKGAGLSADTVGKVGRNTGACWTQTGHLSGRTRKIREHVEAAPAAVAFAAFLGHRAGLRGGAVLRAPWARVLDLPTGGELAALRRAHKASLLDLQEAGSVVEVGFSLLDGTR